MTEAAPFAFRRYLLRVLVPGVLVSAVGLAMLVREGRAAAHKTARIVEARALAAMDDVREHIRDAGPTNDVARVAAFAEFLARGARLDSGGADGTNVFSSVPVAGFVWEPKGVLRWQQGLAPVLAARLTARPTWSAWVAPGRRPVRRALERLDDASGGTYLLWGRVADELYGLVFDAPPKDEPSDTGLWAAAFLLVGALAALLVFEAVRLWRSAERARRDDARKTRFVSDVSHELKTPLAAMGLWLDMLQAGRLADPARRAHALTVVAEEKNRLLRLVESLLDFTRVESGRRRYVREPVDLAAAAREAVALEAGDFPPDGVRCLADAPAPALADPDAVREILLNLLGNAAKYAAAGGPVEVRAAVEARVAYVTVSDRGPGLSPDEQARVFERFYRAESDAARAKGGFGLGLPISRALARGMGGDLVVSARPGGGAVFRLTLPPIV